MYMPYILLVGLGFLRNALAYDAAPFNNTFNASAFPGSAPAFQIAIGVGGETRTWATPANGLAGTTNHSGCVGALVVYPGRPLDSNSVALISCDSDDVVTWINQASSASAACMILYSAYSDYCNFTTPIPDSVGTAFTTISNRDASMLLYTIQQYTQYTGSFTSTPVIANITHVSSTSTTGVQAAAPTASSSSQASTWQPSTTSVAMVILYVITSLIGILFCVIIVLGARRARRHPERYGMYGGVGSRPRRARGIARAMLDTFPVIRFGSTGDHENRKDFEMTGGGANDGDGAGTGDKASVDHREGVAEDGQSIPARPAPQEVTEAQPCAICMDEFENGEELRVLPCEHQFHPACVDPWLLNVSSLCPLCRQDVRQTPEERAQAQLDNASVPAIADPASNETTRARPEMAASVLGNLVPHSQLPQSSNTERRQSDAQGQHSRRFQRYLAIMRRRRGRHDQVSDAALQELRDNQAAPQRPAEGQVRPPAPRIRRESTLSRVFSHPTGILDGIREVRNS
ncbi:hypothetical protein SAICODRAFT_4940 [Saitoella complicata NRRL Y-17804]|uniref:RING-type domain-containing protein n=1 Tax=Saitoella complicata (strain BCRC 22490 / CBS 7301 / JCM 7358 / NBRC 10748 / NRRL Y-17804) TaxID=698492 RepID=A0A0E9N892_SAICN|nr:uncharacterized protein SAICODRAFT_4940 [Saitoella complicata NRRL Y-17804]ODQ55711.1 hypothetical protein SAICODRAFT_4940 [Saitoella complicata NRRL Y-17804]GAO46127.1 hypothetical protein G7K_0366-t1 [Saitoella complicata NRRL Y-17804]